MCDVGQGEAILIKTPAGKKILVDTGPDNSVLECLGENMLPADRKIDVIVLTQSDSDHSAGMRGILEKYENNIIYINKISLKFTKDILSEVTGYQKRPDNIPKLGILESGNTFTIDNVKFQVLWPPNFYQSSDPNDNSLVLRVESSQSTVLLTGDAAEKVWRFLELTNRLPKPVTILKVSHHGAKNCCTKTLIKSVQPKIALISSGKNNRFGHPHALTLELLENAGIPVRRTDLEGTIKISLAP